MMNKSSKMKKEKKEMKLGRAEFEKILKTLGPRNGSEIFTTAQKDALTGAIQQVGNMVLDKVQDELNQLHDRADSARTDRQDIRDKLNEHIKSHEPKAAAYFVDPAKMSDAWTRVEPNVMIVLPKHEKARFSREDKMPPATLEALKESIRIWILRAKGEQVSDACPLCRSLRRYCLSCPVFQKTGNINNGCIGTPWQKWYTTHHKDVAERQKHAYEEALFLFNLLPEEEIIAEFTIFFLRKELEKKNEKK